MIPREPTRRIERAVVTSIEISVDEANPNALTGTLQVLDLDAGLRFEIGLCYPRHKPEAHAAIAKLQTCAYPEGDGRKVRRPPPEISLEVAVEFDRSLRLVGFERRQP